jgi:transcription elongation factor GreA
MKKSMSKLPMTAAGHAALEDELKRRIRVERPRVVQRIQEAIADDSNLAENSEYQAARAEQDINEARISELENKLARAEIIDVSKLSGDTIKFGATVTLIDEDTGEKKVWQIVGEPEADASQGKISVTSPIARALIGKTKGATAEVEAPGGVKVYKVGQVEWLDDRLRKRV